MTTVGDDNVHALAVEGTFDDCQAIVKGLFNDHALPRRACALSGVNSINWARIVAQIVYYFTAAVALGAPDAQVTFTVPTGNFGDIFAGYVAKRMGLPIERLRDRHQRQRHPRRARSRPAATRCGEVHASTLALDGHPGVVELRAPAVRGPGRDAGDACARLMAGSRSPARFGCRDAALAAIRERVRCRPRRRDRDRARHRADADARRGYLLDPHTRRGVRGGRSRYVDGECPCRARRPPIPPSSRPRWRRPAAYRPGAAAWLVGSDDEAERSTVLDNDQVDSRALLERSAAPPAEEPPMSVEVRRCRPA